MSDLELKDQVSPSHAALEALTPIAAVVIAADVLQRYAEDGHDRSVIADLRDPDLLDRFDGDRLTALGASYVATLHALRFLGSEIVGRGENPDDIGTPLGDLFWLQATAATKLIAQLEPAPARAAG